MAPKRLSLQRASLAKSDAENTPVTGPDQRQQHNAQTWVHGAQEPWAASAQMPAVQCAASSSCEHASQPLLQAEARQDARVALMAELYSRRASCMAC